MPFNPLYTHGGARPGSGRPRMECGDKKESTGFSLYPDEISWIDNMRGKRSRSRFLSELIQLHIQAEQAL